MLFSLLIHTFVFPSCNFYTCYGRLLSHCLALITYFIGWSTNGYTYLKHIYYSYSYSTLYNIAFWLCLCYGMPVRQRIPLTKPFKQKSIYCFYLMYNRLLLVGHDYTCWMTNTVACLWDNRFCAKIWWSNEVPQDKQGARAHWWFRMISSFTILSNIYGELMSFVVAVLLWPLLEVLQVTTSSTTYVFFLPATSRMMGNSAGQFVFWNPHLMDARSCMMGNCHELFWIGGQAGLWVISPRQKMANLIGHVHHFMVSLGYVLPHLNYCCNVQKVGICSLLELGFSIILE